MLYKQIGTDTISALGFGTYCLQQSDVIEYAIDCGINFVDTAEEYDSEEIVSKIKRKVFIATKISPENLRYNDVITACDRSLSKLKRDQIDLYQIHRPNINITISDTLAAFDYLRKQGKIRYIGVSNFSLNQLKEANSIINIDSVQNKYSYIEDEMLSYCKTNNIILIAYEKMYTPDKKSWIINNGNTIALIKSLNKTHIKENCDLLNI